MEMKWWFREENLIEYEKVIMTIYSGKWRKRRGSLNFYL